MFFVMHALDKANALAARLAHYDAHKAFLSDTSKYRVSIVMSGPLVAEDGKTMIGSLMILEATIAQPSKPFIAPTRFTPQEYGKRSILPHL